MILSKNMNEWFGFFISICVMILMAGVLLDGWRHKRVKVPRRFSQEPIYKSLNPIQYWGVMCTYLFCELFLLLPLYASIRLIFGDLK